MTHRQWNFTACTASRWSRPAYSKAKTSSRLQSCLDFPVPQVRYSACHHFEFSATIANIKALRLEVLRPTMIALKRYFLLLLLPGLLSALVLKQDKQMAADQQLAAKIARFAPTELSADTKALSAKDQEALKKIIEAAKLLDPLFLRQVWSGNDALEKKLKADKSALGQQRLHYFYINNGPW